MTGGGTIQTENRSAPTFPLIISPKLVDGGATDGGPVKPELGDMQAKFGIATEREVLLLFVDV